MTVLVLGAGLRGAAACYLLKKAGHRVLLTDRKRGPAIGLADEFVPFEAAALPAAEAIFPATTDEALLAAARGRGLVYDPAAPEICLSKLVMDEFLEQNGFRRPQRFPDGSEPYIVKPDRDSFGRGIWSTEDFCEAGGAVNADFLVQEELTGDLVSVTLVGREGTYSAGPVLALETDDRYDLCRAAWPAPVASEAAEALRAEALRLAALLGAEGLLELQAVCRDGACHILELNRLLPPLSALCLEAAGGANLAAALLEGGCADAAPSTPCAALCLKNEQPCGRRNADGSESMSEQAQGFGNAVYRLGVEANP